MPVQTTRPQATSAPGTGQPARTNHLIHETSPYLLQHAHNPVDWYAWGDEAFAAARQQDKPIFLSIGYSTCYWCHVMERESFENEDIAAIMNENFVCIKVDREERPDVDEIYMAAVQALSGQGGWPMSLFLDPKSLKPFMGGTYFPPQDKFGMPGFPSILRMVANLWKTQQAAQTKQADYVAKVVAEHLTEASQPVSIGKKQVDAAIAALLSNYDAQDGGWLSPPTNKFPVPANLDFLIGAAWETKGARDAVTHTLDRMGIGGIYDQVGGGFHRYSTDEQWLVPHFEKMLYDNGQLVSTYAKALELTKEPLYAEIVRETLDYVLREMTSPEGAFYSAQDAEAEAREGGNYIWTQAQMRDALTAAGLKDDVDFALDAYGLKKGTNFRDPHHPEAEPANVLHLSDKPAGVARQMGIAPDQFSTRIDRINQALVAARAKRPQPGTDDKILTAWNGLMIAGMADGGRVLSEKKYKDAAARAAQFILQNMRTKDGGLLRTSRGGTAKIDAFLEDYAFMIRGLIALHRATNDRRLLDEATSLTKIAKDKFWDSGSGSGGGGRGGAFFDTRDGQSDLFVRVKTTYDSSVPSGNSIMLLNLIDLHELTGQAAYLDDAAATLKAISSAIAKQPTGSILAVLALNRFVQKYPQRLDQPAQASASTASTGPAPTKTDPVVLSVEPKEIQVKPGSPGTFTITAQIHKSFHINAHEPGDEFLVPLKIALTGADGLNMTVDYPRGDSFKGEISENTIYMHRGTVTIPVHLEQTGKFSGQPRITLTYQACTDKECLEPKTLIVGIRIIAQR